jgi:hypothetical protein
MSNDTPPPETKPAPPKKSKPNAAEPERLSPQEWAARLGQIAKLRAPLGEKYFADYRHGMARAIHGWGGSGTPGQPPPGGGYEYHEGRPFLLTLADYQAALKVAESAPPYKPHKPALTDYAPLEYRKPAAK